MGATWGTEQLVNDDSEVQVQILRLLSVQELYSAPPTLSCGADRVGRGQKRNLTKEYRRTISGKLPRACQSTR